MKSNHEAEVRVKGAEEELVTLRSSSLADLERKEEEAKEAAAKIEGLEAQVEALKAQAVADRAALDSATESHAAAVAKLKVDNGLLLAERDDAVKVRTKVEGDLGVQAQMAAKLHANFTEAAASLKAGMEAEAKRSSEARRVLQAGVKDLKKQLEEQKAKVTSAVEIYKATDDYDVLKVELGEFGFEILKQELIKRELLDASAFNALNFLDLAAGPSDDEGDK